MTPALRNLLDRWLTWLMLGTVLSFGICAGLMIHDVNGFASNTLDIEGGALIRATLWALLSVFLAPVIALTDALFAGSP